ncbi:hypothetical protein MHK_003720 [Candidatus Magnetomorum sp. HK-1]|nr:hypothetical protein MHK_003720 [Candidatus Magnetomorum sp. HK-1]
MKISWNYIESSFIPQQKQTLLLPNNEVKQILKTIEEQKLSQKHNKTQLLKTLEQRFKTNKEIERDV